MQTNRAGFLDELDVVPTHVERKKVTQTVIAEVEEETVAPEPPKKKSKKEDKQVGWDEDTF